MNKRTLLIVAAIALPIVMLVAVAGRSPSHAPHRVPVAQQKAIRNPAIGLERARNRVRARLEQLQKMQPAQWAAQHRKHPRAPATLEEAIANNKKRLAALEAMTPKEWAEQRRKHRKRHP